MLTVIQAIAKMEGFYVTGSRASRNNNPGNIDFETWMTATYNAELETIPHGFKESARFACFPDESTGFNALRDLLTVHYNGLTIEQAINKYAPPVENATNVYVSSVCEWCDIQPSTVLTSELIG